jgi:hypothetical protein
VELHILNVRQSLDMLLPIILSYLSESLLKLQLQVSFYLLFYSNCSIWITHSSSLHDVEVDLVTVTWPSEVVFLGGYDIPIQLSQAHNSTLVVHLWGWYCSHSFASPSLHHADLCVVMFMCISGAFTPEYITIGAGNVSASTYFWNTAGLVDCTVTYELQGAAALQYAVPSSTLVHVTKGMFLCPIR